MQREDYLLAWIRRYLRWLAEILGFVKVADYERALRRAETALRGLLNMGVDAALAADESELAARLALGEFSSETREKCLILAALFYQIGRAAAGKNDAALARRARLKALHILLGIRLRPDETALPDYLPSVERIVKELDGAPLPTRTAAALMHYFEQEGRFGEAFGWLRRTLENAPRQDEAREIALGFCRRMAVLSPETLRAGGLNPEEIETTRKALETEAANRPSSDPR